MIKIRRRMAGLGTGALGLGVRVIEVRVRASGPCLMA